jgi:hypothetical protein
MNTRIISVISAAIFLAAGLSSIADAAFYQGTDTLLSGRAPFSSSSAQLYGDIDYAVYSPGNFFGSDLYPDKYFYCYQIFNSSDSSSIARFTINLAVNETAYNPDYFIFSSGDFNPLTTYIDSTTVAFLFHSSYRITPNHNSSVLFFAADSGSITNSVIITGTTNGSVNLEIPFTVPEPAAIVLFALAVPALLKRHKYKN